MTKRTISRYSREFRIEAVKMVVEGGISAYEASHRLSLPKSTLENWVSAFNAGKLDAIGGNQRPLTDIEEELARVKEGDDVGKTGARHLKKPPRTLPGSRCPVRGNTAASIRAFRTSSLPDSGGFASGFYAWHETAGITTPEKRKHGSRSKSKRLTGETGGAYGPSVCNDLAEHGIYVGVHKIKRLRKLELEMQADEKFKVTTNSNHSLPVAGNLLGQNFSEYIEIFYNRQRLQKDLGTFHLPLMRKNISKNDVQHEGFGVRY